jgi:antitoxin CptB
MTGMGRSSEGLNPRRRMLLFRSWHRGIREMDLIMGRFADTCIADLSDPELDEYQRLLDIPDHDLYTWISGEALPPPEFESAILARLRAFHMNAGAP